MSEENVIGITEKSDEAREKYMKLSGEYVDKKAILMKLHMEANKRQMEFEKENAALLSGLQLAQSEMDEIVQKFADLEFIVAGIEKSEPEVVKPVATKTETNKIKEEGEKDGQK